MQKIMIKRFLATSLIWFLLIIQFGCLESTNNYEFIDNFPVPEKAYNVKKLKLAEDTYQLFFQVTEPYPSIRMMDMYRDFLNKKGWTSCSGLNSDWSSYVDRSSDNHLLVHKIANYWVDKEDSKLLIFSAMYYSQDISKTQPDNNKQRLIIWVQRTTNLNNELLKLGIKCNWNE